MSTTSKQLPEDIIVRLPKRLGTKKINKPVLLPESLISCGVKIQTHSLSFTLYKPLTTLPNAMRAKGLVPPKNIQPGITTRFSTNEKPKDKAGWVHLLAGNQLAQFATFGCYRANKRYVWHFPRSMALLKCNVIYLIKTAPGGSNAHQVQFIQILSISITVF